MFPFEANHIRACVYLRSSSPGLLLTSSGVEEASEAEVEEPPVPA